MDQDHGKSDGEKVIKTADYSTVGRQKHGKKHGIRWSVASYRFAYRKAMRSMFPGRPGVPFVRRQGSEAWRPGCERFQAIARNPQGISGRLSGPGVFRQRQACCLSGQVQSRKRIDRECVGRYQGRSGCRSAFYLVFWIGVFHTLPPNVGSWKAVYRAIQILDWVIAWSNPFYPLEIASI